jgi:hypothetical protein
VLEEVADLALGPLVEVVDVLDVAQRGSFASTATTLSSPPASSSIFSTATGRTFAMTPGYRSRSSSSSTSSGSPSSPRVSSKKP